MSEHLVQVLYGVACALAGALPAAAYGWFRGWKRELRAEGARSIVAANEVKERGKLEQRLDELEKDIQGVAEVMRDYIKKAEKKSVAMETFVTGQMPRVSGESEAAR